LGAVLTGGLAGFVAACHVLLGVYELFWPDRAQKFWREMTCGGSERWDLLMAVVIGAGSLIAALRFPFPFVWITLGLFWICAAAAGLLVPRFASEVSIIALFQHSEGYKTAALLAMGLLHFGAGLVMVHAVLQVSSG